MESNLTEVEIVDGKFKCPYCPFDVEYHFDNLMAEEGWHKLEHVCSICQRSMLVVDKTGGN